MALSGSPLRVSPDDGPLHLGAPKVIIVGSVAVGKTSILRRARTGHFEAHEPTSIGCACVGLSVELPNGRTKALQVWDTAGQERFNALSRQYMRGAAAAVVVFSLSDRQSLAGASAWLVKASEALKEFYARSTEALPPGGAAGGGVLVLVGNKCDLTRARQVAPSEGRALAAKHHAAYHECAAATGVGVAEIFGLVASALSGRAAASEFSARASLREAKERPWGAGCTGCGT